MKTIRKVELCYQIEDRQETVSSDGNIHNEDLAMSLTTSSVLSGERLRLRIAPLKKMKLLSIKIKGNHDFDQEDQIYVNGYQSWTDSEELPINASLKQAAWWAKPLLKKYHIYAYGDYAFYNYQSAPGTFHGYTYSYVRSGSSFDLMGSLSEREGFTIFSYDVSHHSFMIEKECEGLEIFESYQAFDLFFCQGSEKDVFNQYFAMMDITKPSASRATGWTSWYNYYQEINEELLLSNLESLSALENRIDIFQIDDGYQERVGDWLQVDAKKFPHGMKAMADAIHAKGMKAGLWLAPFGAQIQSTLVETHPDWLLRDEANQPINCGSNWGGFYALDFYNKAFRNYLKHVFKVVLEEWGYDLVKLDFLYAACMIPRLGKTRGTIMCEAMDFIRECVGDKLILGCGVPLGAAFGKVDYCRIGCDIALEWDDKPYLRFQLRERISTKRAIKNAIGRRQLDGRAFMNDPDVFLLRDENINLTPTQKRTLALVNHLFGSLLFTSDDVSHYDSSKQTIFDAVMAPRVASIEDVQIRGSQVFITYRKREFHHLIINLSEQSYAYHDEKMHDDIMIPAFDFYMTEGH